MYYCIMYIVHYVCTYGGDDNINNVGARDNDRKKIIII